AAYGLRLSTVRGLTVLIHLDFGEQRRQLSAAGLRLPRFPVAELQRAEPDTLLPAGAFIHDGSCSQIPRAHPVHAQ
ncbi:hypothetical protein N3553_25795, partial [Pantoea dispersa]|uniref:hypothetical protein n=1 Tax=Pantoea dispersa TaxID=59814 RepID=UPI0021AE45C7